MDTQHVVMHHNVKPNRALGQNFLTDKDTQKRIALSAIFGSLPVLEIGAGLGFLTEELLALGAEVTAVEIDSRLCDILKKRLPSVRIIHADFLNIDMHNLLYSKHFCAVGNLPYYATTAIAEKLLCAMPEQVVIMVQKVAAVRFFALPG